MYTRMGPLFFLSIFLFVFFVGCTTTSEPEEEKPQEENYYKIPFSQLNDYAIMARLVYLDDERIIRVYAPYLNVYIRTLSENDGKYFILTDLIQEAHWIAIRGTANITNVIIDIDPRKTKDETLDVELHTGFRKASIELDADLHGEEELLNKNWPVIVVGHSLGGAMANIVGAYLIERGYLVPRIVTFGQPMITNAEGKKKLSHLPIIRFVNEGDPIPYTPPEGLFDSEENLFRSLGLEVFLDRQGAHYGKVGEDYEENEKNSFWKQLITNINIEEHFIDRYIERIYPVMEKTLTIQFAPGQSWIHQKPDKPSPLISKSSRNEN